MFIEKSLNTISFINKDSVPMNGMHHNRIFDNLENIVFTKDELEYLYIPSDPYYGELLDKYRKFIKAESTVIFRTYNIWLMENKEGNYKIVRSILYDVFRIIVLN